MNKKTNKYNRYNKKKGGSNNNNNNNNNKKNIENTNNPKYRGSKKIILDYVDNYLYGTTVPRITKISQHRKRYYHENTFNRDMMNLCVLMSIKKKNYNFKEKDLKFKFKAFIAIRFYENFLKIYEYNHLYSLIKNPGWLLKNTFSLGAINLFKSTDIQIFLEREKFYYLIYESFLKLYNEDSSKLYSRFKVIVDNEENLYFKIYNLIHIFFKTMTETEQLYSRVFSSENRAKKDNGGQALYANKERGSLKSILKLFDFIYLDKYRKENMSGGFFRNYYKSVERRLREGDLKNIPGYPSRNSKLLEKYRLSNPIAQKEITEDSNRIDQFRRYESANTDVADKCQVYINNRDTFKLKIKSYFMRKYYVEILNNKIKKFLNDKSEKILTLFLVAFFEYNNNVENIEYVNLSHKKKTHGVIFEENISSDRSHENDMLYLTSILKGGHSKKRNKSNKRNKSKKRNKN